MIKMKKFFDNHREWFLKPLTVTIVGGLIVGIVILALNLYVKRSPGEEITNNQFRSRNKRNPKVFYSCSWKKIGANRKYTIFGGKSLCEMIVMMKVALLADSPEDIRIYFPINGKLISYDFPDDIEVEEDQLKQTEDKSFDVLLKQIQPGQTVNFTFRFHPKYDFFDFDKDSFLIFNGNSQTLDWRKFREQLENEMENGWGKNRKIKYTDFGF
jgi:hypothetical protein